MKQMMKQITLDDLKSYQTTAAGKLAQMIQEYPSANLSAWYSQKTGELLPLLCRLRAVTGSGKTPILALASAQLQNGIILWTTNRGAIISQTRANLDTGGKYAPLLPEGTQVYILGEMTTQQWEEVTQATAGLTILLATVASFNQVRARRLFLPWLPRSCKMASSSGQRTGARLFLRRAPTLTQAANMRPCCRRVRRSIFLVR